MNNNQETIKQQWQQRTLAQQMGNIGSEVGRALKWKNTNEVRKTNAIERALELFDFTISDPRWIKNRLKEICRSREVVVDYFYGDNEYNSSPQSLEKYFFYYALVARNNK